MADSAQPEALPPPAKRTDGFDALFETADNLRLGQSYVAAADAYARAAASEPNNPRAPRALANRVECLVALGRFPEARVALNDLERRYPRFSGEISLAREQLARAEPEGQYPAKAVSAPEPAPVPASKPSSGQ